MISGTTSSNAAAATTPVGAPEADHRFLGQAERERSQGQLIPYLVDVGEVASHPVEASVGLGPLNDLLGHEGPQHDVRAA